MKMMITVVALFVWLAVIIVTESWMFNITAPFGLLTAIVTMIFSWNTECASGVAVLNSIALVVITMFFSVLTMTWLFLIPYVFWK